MLICLGGGYIISESKAIELRERERERERELELEQ